MTKRFLLLLTVLLFSTISSCKPALVVQDWIPLKADRLRNGSVAMYAIKNRLGEVEVYFKNHIMQEAENLLIVQEYTGKTEEYTKRLRLDGTNLNLLSYEVIQNNKEADLSKTTINQLQFTMLTGKKTNQTYLISDFLEDKPKYIRLFIGNFFIEGDFLLTQLSAFPFEEQKQGSYKVVRTMSVMDPNEKNYWETKTFSVTDREEILYKRQSIPAYRVSFPAEKTTAWFREEAPHILLKAELTSTTVELIDWNEL